MFLNFSSNFSEIGSGWLQVDGNLGLSVELALSPFPERSRARQAHCPQSAWQPSSGTCTCAPLPEKKPVWQELRVCVLINILLSHEKFSIKIGK